MSEKSEKEVEAYKRKAVEGGHFDPDMVGVNYAPDLDPGPESRKQPTEAPKALTESRVPATETKKK